MTVANEHTAALLMAYGTPCTPDEILAYYTDIRRGRPPTVEQLAALVHRYESIAPGAGGDLSPLRLHSQAQRDALQVALDAIAPERFSVALGFKHAEPRIEEAVDCIAASGIRRIVCVVLAPHFSASSVGEYELRVRAAASRHDLHVIAVESWATEPAFVDFLARALETALARVPDESAVCFTAHSLPRRFIDAGDPYPFELAATATAVSERVGLTSDRWSIAWQSAGRTPEPWLGPDILEVVDSLAAAGAPGLVVCACGFVADHLEVLYDLDVEAASRAAARGLPFTRTECVNDDPGVISGLARRVFEA